MPELKPCPFCGLPGNVLQHKLICEYLNDLYARKNADYGDSFHQDFLEEGWAMPRIRLSDKLNRFKTLSRVEDSKVKDESLRDALIDLANYAIMSVMELGWMTDDAAREKPSDASDYGFVTAEQAAENIAKAAAAAFGNKAEEEKPAETDGREFDAMARAKKTADSFLRKAVDTHVIIPHSYAVMRDDGVIYCDSCDDPLHCDENGDMPYICPSCGNIIDYSDIVMEKTPQEKSHGKTFTYNGGWQRKEAPNNES